MGLGSAQDSAHSWCRHSAGRSSLVPAEHLGLPDRAVRWATPTETARVSVRFTSGFTVLEYVVSILTILLHYFPVQIWMSVCSGSHANMNAKTPLAVLSVCAPRDTSYYPMAEAAKVGLSVCE